MTLPANDDLSNRELSIEELEAIAAGGWLGSFVHFVAHEISDAAHWVLGPGAKIVGNILSHPYRGESL